MDAVITTTESRTRGRGRSWLALALVVGLAGAGRVPAEAKDPGPGVPPPKDPDPAAAQYCLNRQGLTGQPQMVKGFRVVVVCVHNYQYLPGDDNLAPCAGYVAGTPASMCADVAHTPAPKLEIPLRTQLLFVVPDPNMHTLTSAGCPNLYEDPPSPDPLGAFNLVVHTAEQALFGPDQIATSGVCRFDSYPLNGGTHPPTPGTGALVGPRYETVDTSHLRPGIYHFYCQVHAFMRGTLVVAGGRDRS